VTRVAIVGAGVVVHAAATCTAPSCRAMATPSPGTPSHAVTHLAELFPGLDRDLIAVRMLRHCSVGGNLLVRCPGACARRGGRTLAGCAALNGPSAGRRTW
jgi:hypothetical protein